MLALLDETAMAANAYRRPDLSRRLVVTRRRLADPSLHVLVVGEFKQGKSSLLNALVQASACPVDDDVATAVPTAVRYAETPRAALVYEPEGDGFDEEPKRQEIALELVPQYVTEAANPENRKRLRAVEIGLPRPALQTGLVLVDTPGVGGLGSAHTATTVGALPLADALLFVSDASQEYSRPELDFLATARELCPNVTCVLTKIDFYPEWRTILEVDKIHLETNRVSADVIPVSSVLRNKALEIGDTELHRESGFPALVRALTDKVVGNAEQLSLKVTFATIMSAITQLEAQLSSEREALADPKRVQALVGRLEAARDNADRLRSQASRWQQTLGDGIADLASDVDHDLNLRVRELLRAADDAIDEGDPGDVWDEFERWVYRRVTEEVTRNYTLLHTRAGELGRLVTEHFGKGSEELGVALDPGAPEAALETVRASASADLERMNVTSQALSVLRSGYMGTMMFGMIAQGLSLAMISPATVAIGLVMGKRGLGEEKKRQLAVRRAQAKNAVRKYVDEARFLVAKDSRDTIRNIHRQLRDHFAALAEELHRSTNEAVLAAQQAASMDEKDRTAQLRNVEAELRRIANLKARVTAADPQPAAR